MVFRHEHHHPTPDPEVMLSVSFPWAADPREGVSQFPSPPTCGLPAAFPNARLAPSSATTFARWHAPVQWQRCDHQGWLLLCLVASPAWRQVSAVARCQGRLCASGEGLVRETTSSWGSEPAAWLRLGKIHPLMFHTFPFCWKSFSNYYCSSWSDFKDCCRINSTRKSNLFRKECEKRKFKFYSFFAGCSAQVSLQLSKLKCIVYLI